MNYSITYAVHSRNVSEAVNIKTSKIDRKDHLMGKLNLKVMPNDWIPGKLFFLTFKIESVAFLLGCIACNLYAGLLCMF
jgi:hypothetical protein